MMMSEVREEDEKTKWREVLYDFSQNTTLHACRQITEPTPFLLRRVFWILLLALGMGLFLYQVYESSIYYLSNPVAVNIMINYNDTVRFPAVTICNQNAFRMTAAAEHGLYNALSDLYGSTDLAEATNRSEQEDMTRLLDMPLFELYQLLGHNKRDFIVDCQWEQSPCSMDDFEPTLTDHGICYTFNNGGNGNDIKNATQTGAAWGLRVRLNVEQYEYMMGPNAGAGIGVLIHEQGDFPRVSDHGQAVPPGLHAFLGVSIVQIHDLKPPHGKCMDGRKLEHFDRYTQAACFSECQQEVMRESCACNHVHRPQNFHEHGVPPCSVRRHLECIQPALNAFHDFRQQCRCPHPCDRTIFDPTITYGDTSIFDTEKLLQADMTSLQSRYLEARDVGQKVHPAIADRDRHLAADLRKYVAGVTVALQSIPERLVSMMTEYLMEASMLNLRASFHKRRALAGVKFILEHDFVRGWSIVEERTFDHVATGFWEVVSSFDRVVELLNGSWSQAGKWERKLLWHNLDERLFNRLTMAERALTNLTEVDEAYHTGKPLLRFYYTKDRRYDMSFIPLHLLRHDPETQAEQFGYCRDGLQKYKTAIEAMRQYGAALVDAPPALNESASGEGPITTEASVETVSQVVDILAEREAFIASAKAINYRLFQFKSKVLLQPVHLIDNIIDEFRRRNTTLWREYELLRSLVVAVDEDVRRFSAQVWSQVEEASRSYTEYNANVGANKSDLVRRLATRQTADLVLQLSRFFLDLRGRAREIGDVSTRMRKHHIELFLAIAEERSTAGFYGHVAADVAIAEADPAQKELLMPYFASLLRKKPEKIAKKSMNEIKKMLNADTVGMNVTAAAMDLTVFFDKRILPASRLDEVLGNTDELLIEVLEEIRADLNKFNASTNINYNFFQENFLNVDVYMRQLSYEEITQQIAYDLTNLWSDIGGSIGLFIGASAISVFELLDILLHTSLKMGRERHRAAARRRRSRRGLNDRTANGSKSGQTGWML